MKFICAIYCNISRASDPVAGWGGGGPRNMKSMWLPLAAIFFMTYLYRAEGGMAPSATPLDPLLIYKNMLFLVLNTMYSVGIR